MPKPQDDDAVSYYSYSEYTLPASEVSVNRRWYNRLDNWRNDIDPRASNSGLSLGGSQVNRNNVEDDDEDDLTISPKESISARPSPKLTPRYPLLREEPRIMNDGRMETLRVYDFGNGIEARLNPQPELHPGSPPERADPYAIAGNQLGSREAELDGDVTRIRLPSSEATFYSERQTSKLHPIVNPYRIALPVSRHPTQYTNDTRPNASTLNRDLPPLPPPSRQRTGSSRPASRTSSFTSDFPPPVMIKPNPPPSSRPRPHPVTPTNSFDTADTLDRLDAILERSEMPDTGLAAPGRLPGYRQATPYPSHVLLPSSRASTSVPDEDRSVIGSGNTPDSESTVQRIIQQTTRIPNAEIDNPSPASIYRERLPSHAERKRYPDPHPSPKINQRPTPSIRTERTVQTSRLVPQTVVEGRIEQDEPTVAIGDTTRAPVSRRQSFDQETLSTAAGDSPSGGAVPSNLHTMIGHVRNAEEDNTVQLSRRSSRALRTATPEDRIEAALASRISVLRAGSESRASSVSRASHRGRDDEVGEPSPSQVIRKRSKASELSLQDVVRHSDAREHQAQDYTSGRTSRSKTSVREPSSDLNALSRIQTEEARRKKASSHGSWTDTQMTASTPSSRRRRTIRERSSSESGYSTDSSDGRRRTSPILLSPRAANNFPPSSMMAVGRPFPPPPPSSMLSVPPFISTPPSMMAPRRGPIMPMIPQARPMPMMAPTMPPFGWRGGISPPTMSAWIPPRPISGMQSAPMHRSSYGGPPLGYGQFRNSQSANRRRGRGDRSARQPDVIPQSRRRRSNNTQAVGGRVGPVIVDPQAVGRARRPKRVQPAGPPRHSRRTAGGRPSGGIGSTPVARASSGEVEPARGSTLSWVKGLMRTGRAA